MNHIDKIIYLYLFICIVLLLFNIIYILRSGRVKKKAQVLKARWKAELKEVFSGEGGQTEVSSRHLQLLEKKLTNVNELMAYHNAMFPLEEGFSPEKYEAYFEACYPAFLSLAWKYEKHAPMERAFFAYMISVCFCYVKAPGGRILEALLAYLDHSTVYCRENVLNALYVFGNISVIDRAFEYISERGWYHHPRLISDGMRKFRGNKEELIRFLWERRHHMEECFAVGIVQFATNTSDGFAREFLAALQDETEDPEVRLAIIRYFRRYPFGEAKDYLKLLLRDHEEGIEFAIVASAALEAYPGEDTKSALKEALHSHNWYVRKNAAMSLKKLKITAQDREEIEASGDRYANEILAYVEERESP